MKMFFNRILFLTIIMASTFLLNGCVKEPPLNYKITKHGVGEFSLFDPVTDHIERNNVVRMKVDGANTIGYVENNDTLYYVGDTSFSSRILEIIVKSDRMKLYNGIHVGMSIKSIVPFYPQIRMSMRRLKIAKLGIDLFEGNYAPKEFTDKPTDRINPMEMRGVSFNFEETENNVEKDTILTVIRLKSNLYR